MFTGPRAVSHMSGSPVKGPATPCLKSAIEHRCIGSVPSCYCAPQVFTLADHNRTTFGELQDFYSYTCGTRGCGLEGLTTLNINPV